MNKKCYIVGAGDNSGTTFLKKNNEYLIAADGGLKTIKKLGMAPDIILGDFDSLGYIPKGDNVIVYKEEKDDTDMMIAVNMAIEKGFNEIEIYGGTGGRIDHTFANIQTMLWASRKGILVTMIDSNNIYKVATNEQIKIKTTENKNFSVFAIGDKAQDVTIKGGKYKADNITLYPDNPTAVSNITVENEITINVKKGSILLTIEKK